MDNEKIVLCADHGGFELKEYLKGRLEKDNIDFIDLGGDGDNEDDYPDIISKGAKAIRSKKYKNGIFICGAGIGASIAANRFKGVRAALAWNRVSAIKSREHNNANVIVFSGRYLSFKKAYRLFRLWRKTEFSKKQRHVRRINKLDKVGN